MGRGIGLGFAHRRRFVSTAPTGGTRPPMPWTGPDGIRVVADADLDERGRLVAELTAAGFPVPGPAEDAELIVAAYRAWGVECPTRLHGDFAFALWDDRRRRLLLVRDRFGTRPLYYARPPGSFVFANSLDVLRIHRGVSDELDEGAVGDFLRIGYNSDPTGSIFSSVRCVPAAHSLLLTNGEPVVARYWDLPTDGTVKYTHVEDYADRFAEVLRHAVADRLRGTNAAVILLSGGRDSTAVAAMARAVAGPDGTPRLHAVTAVFDYALRDEERTYAGLAGGALGIPVDFLPQDEYGWYESWERDDLWRPEPPESPELAGEAELHARAAAHARIGLTGEGGDAALRESESHLAHLIRSGRWRRAAAESWRYVGVHHRLPRPGFRRLRLRRAGLVSPYSAVPPWLRPDFIARAKLRDRWAALEAEDARQWMRHPTRPEAFTKLRATFWARCFEEEHATATGQLLTLRHPFFDERVIAFLLALPTEQWLNDKGIVVAAMRRHLPARVVYRDKTPLAGDSYEVAFGVDGRRPDRAAFEPRALQFVEPDALFDSVPGIDEDERWDWVRAYSFSRWLGRLGVGRRFSQLDQPVLTQFEP